MYDRSYIPLTVLEQSGSKHVHDRYCLNQWGSEFYDIPSSTVGKTLNLRKGSYGEQCIRIKCSDLDLGDRYKKDFYRGRRHTLSSAHYNRTGLHEFSYFPQGWYFILFSKFYLSSLLLTEKITKLFL